MTDECPLKLSHQITLLCKVHLPDPTGFVAEKVESRNFFFTYVRKATLLLVPPSRTLCTYTYISMITLGRLHTSLACDNKLQ